MRFEMYQDRLRELGVEAGEARRAADAAGVDDRKVFEAQYTRAITKIDQTVADINTEHPKLCWHDDDPKYQALSALWRAARGSQK